ncbi:MAG: hypothetical protein H6726_01100 [Sandaracinaceae bacterium]|nr:hypothetical protein [Sandaracinaceae bacterium]
MSAEGEPEPDHPPSTQVVRAPEQRRGRGGLLALLRLSRLLSVASASRARPAGLGLALGAYALLLSPTGVGFAASLGLTRGLAPPNLRS